MTPERLQYVREAHGRGMEPHWYHAVTSELLAEIDRLGAVEQDRDRLSDELARVGLRQEWSILHPHSGISYGPNNRTQLDAIIAGWPGEPKPQLVWRWVSDWQPAEDAAEHSGEAGH